MAGRAGRAAPLTPDERRDGLIETYLHLVRSTHRQPSTAEIAAAAGVAEGTIFRAFPTKEKLESEAVQTAFCPAPVRRDLAAIDPDLDLRGRLVAFTDILQRRFTGVFGLMSALGLSRPPERSEHPDCYPGGRHVRGGRVIAPTTATTPGGDPDEEPLFLAIHIVVAGHEHELALPAREVVHRIRMLTFSASHPGISSGRMLTPEQIVDTILDGVRRRPEPADTGRVGAAADRQTA